MSRVKGQLPDWPRAKRRTPASPAGPTIIRNVRCLLSRPDFCPAPHPRTWSMGHRPRLDGWGPAGKVVDGPSTTLYGGGWAIDRLQGPKRLAAERALGAAQRQVAQPVFWRPAAMPLT